MQQILRRLTKAFASVGLALSLIVGTAHPSAADEPVAGSRIPLPTGPIRGAGANLPDDYYARGNKEIPNLLKAAGVLCTPTQAAYIGMGYFSDSKEKRTISTKFYEAACNEGIGYFVYQLKDKLPIAFDCIAAAESGKLACMLPKNRHPAGGLNPYLQAVGVKCSALRARRIAEDRDQKLRKYEVECSGGGGYVLDIPLSDGTGPAPQAYDCLQTPGACTFTSHVDSVAMLAHAVGETLGSDCRISEARYVGFVGATGRDLYELACQHGHDGLLVELDRTGVVRAGMPCASVKLKGASCQLKPSDAADPLIQHAEMSGAAPPLSMTKMEWQRRPNRRDLDDIYPPQALADRLSGQALVACKVDVSGVLSDCFVTDESPAGYGFGAAALKMSTKFRMKPPTENGAPIGGERVIIPINFAVGRAPLL